MPDNTNDAQFTVETPVARRAPFFVRFLDSLSNRPRPVAVEDDQRSALIAAASGGAVLGRSQQGEEPSLWELEADEAQALLVDLVEHPHADDCPDCGRDIGRQELAWMWQLPLPQLRMLLMEGLGNRHGELAGYAWDLRELALNLILDAPSGPPRDPHMFLQFCTRFQLACNWGGSADPHTSWIGVPGVDVLIVVATGGRPSAVELVAVEFFNLMRDWAANPSAALRAAGYVDIDTDKLPLSN